MDGAADCGLGRVGRWDRHKREGASHFYHVQHLVVQSDVDPGTEEMGQTVQKLTGKWI